MKRMLLASAFCLTPFLAACTNITAQGAASESAPTLESMPVATSAKIDDINDTPDDALPQVDPPTETTSREQTTSTSSPESPVGPFEHSEGVTLLYANEFALDEGCVADQFEAVSGEQLRSVGINEDGVHDSHLYYLDLAIERPIFGVVLRSWSLCADFYPELVDEELGDLFADEVLSCFVEATRTDPDILMLYLLGVPTGQTFDLEAKRDAVQVLYRAGLAKNEEAIATCIAERLSS